MIGKQKPAWRHDWARIKYVIGPLARVAQTGVMDLRRLICCTAVFALLAGQCRAFIINLQKR